VVGAGRHEAGPYTFREHPNVRTVELSNDFLRSVSAAFLASE